MLAYTLAVVAWGAIVRATGSGAGCGNHWPMCNGELVPRSRALETMIEFSHRVTAGLSTLLVVGLLVWSFRTLPSKHPARRAAVFSGVFTFVEALIGAALVLLDKVAKDQSAGRIVYLSVHLINTFLLVGAIALTAWWASGAPRMDWQGRAKWRWGAIAGLVGTLILGVSGAITALGDTLYPSKSLVEGLQADFAVTANFLVSFRKYHPLIAVLVGGYLGCFAMFALLRRRQTEAVKSLAASLLVLIGVQWVLGLLDVALLAPVWMQLVHLLFADILWIAAVLLSVAVNAEKPERPLHL